MSDMCGVLQNLGNLGYWYHLQYRSSFQQSIINQTWKFMK